jgi:hypothetical protein
MYGHETLNPRIKKPRLVQLNGVLSSFFMATFWFGLAHFYFLSTTYHRDLSGVNNFRFKPEWDQR